MAFGLQSSNSDSLFIYNHIKGQRYNLDLGFPTLPPPSKKMADVKAIIDCQYPLFPPNGYILTHSFGTFGSFVYIGANIMPEHARCVCQGGRSGH